jgi:hypothetical protein
MLLPIVFVPLNVKLIAIIKRRLKLNQEPSIDNTIDLVLIDQQSVGKRSLYLMDTVNAKKRWTAIKWRVNMK